MSTRSMLLASHPERDKQVAALRCSADQTHAFSHQHEATENASRDRSADLGLTPAGCKQEHPGKLAIPRQTDSTLSNFNALPDSALIRMKVIVGDAGKHIPPLIPVSRSTWWRMVRSGRAPRPVQVSPGVTAWRVGDIRALLAGEVV